MIFSSLVDPQSQSENEQYKYDWKLVIKNILHSFTALKEQNTTL
jgi:hypothetical protein